MGKTLCHKIEKRFLLLSHTAHKHFDYHSTLKGMFQFKALQGAARDAPLNDKSILQDKWESTAFLRARKVYYCVVYSHVTKQREMWKMPKTIQDQKH